MSHAGQYTWGSSPSAFGISLGLSTKTRGLDLFHGRVVEQPRDPIEDPDSVADLVRQLDRHKAGRLLFDRNVLRHRLCLCSLLKKAIRQKTARSISRSKDIARLDSGVEVEGERFRVDLLPVLFIALRIVVEEHSRILWTAGNPRHGHEVYGHTVGVGDGNASRIAFDLEVIVAASRITFHCYVKLIQHPFWIHANREVDLDDNVDIMLHRSHVGVDGGRNRE